VDVEAYYRTIGDLYDLELADRGDEPFWQRIGQEAQGQRILEIGCGSGRATKLLAAGGASLVVALDLSHDMLARVSARPNVRLLQADMRTPPLRGPFDLIVAADDPFSHLTADADRQQAFDAASALLAPNGRLILDALYFGPTELHRRVDFTTSRTTKADPSLTVQERWRCDPTTYLCHATYTYTRDGQQVAEATCHLRTWSAAELDQRLATAGLELTHRWGSYDRAPWRPDDSPCLIVEARRR
jgi:SAM-dependent methyltransferase